MTDATVKKMRRRTPVRAVTGLFVFAAIICTCATSHADEMDLTGMSIEELMGIKVTSVSKKEQHLSDSAAAIFVITNEDLRHSGVTNIPDALRMVPGLNVARIDSNKWAVNSRGATSRFSDKLLVLIDGRTVYTPTFSGVYWEVQDMMLEDIDRIEVIRGPGATLWGANAVNGVINIITKSSADTQGGLVSLGAGNQETAFAGIRYGTELSEGTHGRLYAKGFERNQYAFEDGDDAGDDWGKRQAGFKIDTNLTARDILTFQGDLYQGDNNQQLDLPLVTMPYVLTVQDNAEVSGSNLMARWQRIISSTSELTLQTYYDHTKRHEAYTNQDLDSLDVDFQHHLRVGDRNDIIWGVRYRNTQSDLGTTSWVSFNPGSRTDDLFSAFIQDEIVVAPELLWLTLGSKIEHNDYTGYEVQPSARLFWAVDPAHKLWASVSRAVRTPSRLETDGQVTNGVIPPTNMFTPPIELVINGNDNFRSESLMAYEVGYRFIPEKTLFLDFAFFYNDYDNFRSAEVETPISLGTYVQQPMRFINIDSIHTYGGEAAVSWQAFEWLKLDLAYSYIDSNIKESHKTGTSPKHQTSLRSHIKLRDDLSLDMWMRYVDEATTLFTNSTENIIIDDYFTFDLRLAWCPTASMELSLVGQNLLDDSHLEFVQEAYSPPTKVQRSVYGKFTYHF